LAAIHSLTEQVVPIEVRVEGVSKSFPRDGGRFEALRDLDLTVPAGRFVSILGPSGSGKSTLLGILAGLDAPDTGKVTLLQSGREANPQSAIGYMPQRDLLLPWRTALDNATVALEVSGMDRREARVQVLPMFGEFGLTGFAGSYPGELSGGMRQRVSFLRSAMLARGLMLLDEPFGALDALTRASMHEWLLAMAERLGSTFVLVTHDVDEAILLSDMVYVLSPRPGRVVGTVTVDLPRPRSLDSGTDERFTAYRKQLLDLLRATGGLAMAGETR
jgi:putative hydroxymethylpyrimidine transport system ATP-binding protein